MNDQDSSSRGCLRCDDYDDIKSELEDLKEQNKEERQGALEQCRESKELLQKKLLKIGAAAVIGGTILGKEFVDKVATYIESFNNVSNVTNNLIGSAGSMSAGDSAGNNSSGKGDEEKKDEKDEERDDKKATPRLASAASPIIPFTPYTNVNPYPIFGQESEESQYSDMMKSVGEMLADIPPLRDDTFAQLISDFQVADNMYRPFDPPYMNDYMTAGYASPTGSTIVPAPGAIGVLLVGSLFSRRRRR